MLGGYWGDMVSLRNRYITGQKLQKEEAIHASKTLTSEQKEYMREKEKRKYNREGLAIIGNISNIVEQNRARRAKNG